VANSPFVRAVEGEQYEYGSQWERPVALKVLELAAEAGMLTPAELRKLDVEVTEPQVASAEPDKDANTNNVLHAAGVMSATTWQLKLGLDPQHEQANFDAEKKRGMVPGDEPPPEPGQQQQGGAGGGGLEALKAKLAEMRDASGHEHGDDGKFSGAGGGGKTHDVRLPKNSKKLTTDQAAAALAQLGYTLDHSRSRFDVKTLTTLIHLTLPDGRETMATTDEVKELVYRNAENPQPKYARRKRGEARVREVRDASGHEHGGDGKFSGTGGGGSRLAAALGDKPRRALAVLRDGRRDLSDLSPEDFAALEDALDALPEDKIRAEIAYYEGEWEKFLKLHGKAPHAPGDDAAGVFGPYVASRLAVLNDALASRAAKGEAREDRTGLVKKKVQGRDGKTHTVYVRPDDGKAADAGGKADTSDSRPHPADSDPPEADSLDLSGVHDDPGVVAKVKEKVGKILTALARRAYDAVLMSPQIIDAAGLLVDTPEDMQKIGYNPATAGADAQKTGNVLQDAGIPLTPYQFVNLCTTVLPGVVSWVKGKLGKSSAAESDDIDALAELLHGLLAELAEEFGFAAPPDAAAIAANLRAL
jgi:hypothetical protein